MQCAVCSVVRSCSTTVPSVSCLGTAVVSRRMLDGAPLYGCAFRCYLQMRRRWTGGVVFPFESSKRESRNFPPMLSVGIYSSIFNQAAPRPSYSFPPSDLIAVFAILGIWSTPHTEIVCNWAPNPSP